MFEVLKINIWGTQPVARVSDKQLEKLIRREFPDNINQVKTRLGKVKIDPASGKNRISAAIIKLANKDVKSLDHYIDVANSDFRDVLSQAEYPRCSKLGFGKSRSNDMKRIYMNDWKEYSKWLND